MTLTFSLPQQTSTLEGKQPRKIISKSIPRYTIYDADKPKGVDAYTTHARTTQIHQRSCNNYVSRTPSGHEKTFKVNRKTKIRNSFNHIPHPTLNINRVRRTHTKFGQRPRTTRTVNRMNSSSQRGVIQLP